MKTMTIVAALAAVFTLTAASAQQTQSAGQSGANLPEACRSAAQASGHGDMMQKMESGMLQRMQGMQGMMAQMTETQKGMHQAMMDMHGPMMTGMMAKDADVAWACSMIPHHSGAIEMSKVVLKHGDNAEIKKMAQKVIDDQGKEISELRDWLQKNANKGSK